MAKSVTLKDGTKLLFSSGEQVNEMLLTKGHKPIEDSDLVAGQYEGGLKIWECALDLCNFIATSLTQRSSLEGLKVLELGCGAALPSILTLKKGAAFVAAQDFNDYVINCFTHPNFNLNGIPKSTFSALSCDWTECVDRLKPERFDLILTSETIYNTDNYEMLHATMDGLLSERGKILVAAKTFYFGVGGSLLNFLEFIRQRDVFEVEEKWCSESAVPRKIVQLIRANKELSF